MEKETEKCQHEDEAGFQVVFDKERKGFIIIEKRLDKRTGKIKTKRIFVPTERVRKLWKIISDNISVTPIHIQENDFNFPFNETRKRYCLSFKNISTLIIIAYNLHVNSTSEFFGARSKAYFPLYYNPMKVLEHYKAINFGVRKTYRLVKSLNDCLPNI
jgi:hypothetical protein